MKLKYLMLSIMALSLSSMLTAMMTQDKFTYSEAKVNDCIKRSSILTPEAAQNLKEQISGMTLTDTQLQTIINRTFKSLEKKNAFAFGSAAAAQRTYEESQGDAFFNCLVNYNYVD